MSIRSLCRLIARKLSMTSGRQVVVDNRPVLQAAGINPQRAHNSI